MLDLSQKISYVISIMKNTLSQIAFESTSMIAVLRKQREQAEREAEQRKAEREVFKAEIKALLHG
jgi:FtsZ-binding cell division protein ZapB